MKKGTIIALIVAAVLLVTGGVLLMLGLSYAAGSEDSVTMLTESEHYIPEDFDSILIKTADCHVNFVPFEGAADPHVVIRERERIHHTVLVEDGVLKIQMVDERLWTDHIGVNWESMEMTVYLPQKQYASLRVYTATGDIVIPQALSFTQASCTSDTGKVVFSSNVTDDLTCYTSTGSITVTGTAPATMRLDSSTGNIHITGVNGNEIELRNDTGKITAENVSCKLLACQEVTGDVVLQNVLAEEYLQVFADTGDIRIENSEAGKVNIETDTGNIKVPAAWQFQRIETDTGNIVFY